MRVILFCFVLCRLTAVCFPIQYPQFFSVRNVRYVLIGSVLYSASTGLSFSLLCFYYHATFQNWENEERFWMLVNRVATLHVITLYSLSILGIVIRYLHQDQHTPPSHSLSPPPLIQSFSKCGCSVFSKGGGGSKNRKPFVDFFIY